MQNRKLEDVCSATLNSAPVITVRDLDEKEGLCILRNCTLFLIKARNPELEVSNK